MRHFLLLVIVMLNVGHVLWNSSYNIQSNILKRLDGTDVGGFGLPPNLKVIWRNRSDHFIINSILNFRFNVDFRSFKNFRWSRMLGSFLLFYGWHFQVKRLSKIIPRYLQVSFETGLLLFLSLMVGHGGNYRKWIETICFC